MEMFSAARGGGGGWWVGWMVGGIRYGYGGIANGGRVCG
jgi:hypothetical protein